MFVKFGQIASTRTDLLPEVLTSELSLLQSSARPVPADDVRAVIESELGATVEEEFASFDFEPLAAASIGQTHRAVLKTGERVVVKVQRPGIEDIVHRDAAVLRFAASTIDRRVEAARQLGVKRLADELIDSLERELDYGAEASSGDGVPRSPRGQGRDRRAHRLPVAVDASRARHGGDRRRDRRRSRGGRGRARVGERARRTAPAVVPRPGAARRAVPRRPAPGEHLRRPRAARSGSSTSARSAGSARSSSSRCRRWRSGSSSTTRSSSPAPATDWPVATSPATAARSRPTSAWCSARDSGAGASIPRR